MASSREPPQTHPFSILSLHTAKCACLETRAGEAALLVTNLQQELVQAQSEGEAQGQQAQELRRELVQAQAEAGAQGGLAQGLRQELAAAAATIERLEADAAASAEKMR